MRGTYSDSSGAHTARTLLVLLRLGLKDRNRRLLVSGDKKPNCDTTDLCCIGHFSRTA